MQYFKESEELMLLEDHLRELMRLPPQELHKIVDNPYSLTVNGYSGRSYQIRVKASWIGSPGGDLNVRASISDGSLWRRILPLSREFFMDKNGKASLPNRRNPAGLR